MADRPFRLRAARLVAPIRIRVFASEGPPEIPCDVLELEGAGPLAEPSDGLQLEAARPLPEPTHFRIGPRRMIIRATVTGDWIRAMWEHTFGAASRRVHKLPIATPVAGTAVPGVLDLAVTYHQVNLPLELPAVEKRPTDDALAAPGLEEVAPATADKVEDLEAPEPVDAGIMPEADEEPEGPESEVPFLQEEVERLEAELSAVEEGEEGEDEEPEAEAEPGAIPPAAEPSQSDEVPETEEPVAGAPPTEADRAAPEGPAVLGIEPSMLDEGPETAEPEAAPTPSKPEDREPQPVEPDTSPDEEASEPAEPAAFSLEDALAMPDAEVSKDAEPDVPEPSPQEEPEPTQADVSPDEVPETEETVAGPPPTEADRAAQEGPAVLGIAPSILDEEPETAEPEAAPTPPKLEDQEPEPLEPESPPPITEAARQVPEAAAPSEEESEPAEPIPSVHRLTADEVASRLQSLDPRDFEALMLETLDRLGFTGIEITRKRPDDGVDAIGSRPAPGGSVHYAIQCRQQADELHMDAARDLAGLVASDPSVDKGLLVSTGELSARCREFVRLVDELEAIPGLPLARRVREFGLELPEAPPPTDA